jgi:hypothetical protein
MRLWLGLCPAPDLAGGASGAPPDPLAGLPNRSPTRSSAIDLPIACYFQTGSTASAPKLARKRAAFLGAKATVDGNPTASIQSSNINFQRDQGTGGVPGDCRKSGRNGVAAI